MQSGRDQKAIVERIIAEMDKAKLDALILTSPHDIFYATGHCSRNVYRSGRIGASAAIVNKSGKVGLVVSEFEKAVAEKACHPSITIHTYPVWIYIEDLAVAGMKKETQPDLNRTWKMACELLEQEKPGMRIGICYKWTSMEESEYLTGRFRRDNLIDCTSLMVEARTVKTPWEIDVLRRNAKASERAMYRTAKATIPGMTPQDIHYLFHRFCLEECPDMTAVSQAHTFADNYTPAWVPDDMRLDAGDLIRLDGGPYAKGYKSDLARTDAVGGRTLPEREQLYAELYKGYEYALAHIGPGVRMCDLFHGVEEVINIPGYVRGHFGHSISCDISGEEAPFIGPKENRFFVPGMVMCVEFPFYSSRRQTYNIEDEIVITENGYEMFTHALSTLVF
ncbi:MAG: M24 family metallopeptidase [Lawsonibacter sp.]|nr:M24 family metallopeptidase [Lawsonibacter sp.]